MKAKMALPAVETPFNDYQVQCPIVEKLHELWKQNTVDQQKKK